MESKGNKPKGVKVKETVTFTEEMDNRKGEVGKAVVKRGHFLYKKEGNRSREEGGWRGWKRRDQLMNITKLTHPVAWNA